MSEFGDNLNAKRNWKILKARTSEELEDLLNSIKIPMQTQGGPFFAEGRYCQLIYSSKPLQKKKIRRKSIKTLDE